MNYPYNCNIDSIEKLCNFYNSFIEKFNGKYSFIDEFENRKKIFKNSKFS